MTRFRVDLSVYIMWHKLECSVQCQTVILSGLNSSSHFDTAMLMVSGNYWWNKNVLAVAEELK